MAGRAPERLLQLLLLVWAHTCHGDVAKLFLLPDAVEKGAVCLDGTPSGYYWRPGTGVGATKWIVHLEGGGWCYNEDDCVSRSKTSLGSSKFWPENATFAGFLSDNKDVNPNFYTWNVAYVKYCDGASFAGEVEKPVVWNGTTLYFRGLRVLKENMESLLTRGMKQAEEVILTGCSAGGLATYLHADYVHDLIPAAVKFRVLADAGFFIDGANISRYMHIRSLYQYVFRMQNCSSGVNKRCISLFSNGGETWRCFFAQYSFHHIKAPMFILNSQYDSWQLLNILQLGCLPPNCPQDKMEHFYLFRNTISRDDDMDDLDPIEDVDSDPQ